MHQSSPISPCFNPPFGSAISEMQFKSDTGGSYRYGFNTQEKDDEIAGEGNSYTAEFWQYDPRVVHRWNTDPKPNPLFSPYAIMQCNPIMYIDHKGDSVGTSFTNSEIQESFNAFFNTGVGKEYIGRYAAKGQTINGHKFKKDGKYHKKGIDLNFKDANLGSEAENGNTSNNRGNLVNGRLKIKITMNSSLNEAEGAKIYKKALEGGVTGWRLNHSHNLYIADRAKTIIHESFIHAELFAQDFMDDGNSKNYSYTKGIRDHHVYVNNIAHYQEDVSKGAIIPLNNPNANNMFYYYGWMAQKAIHKWYGTGLSEREVYNQFWSHPTDHK
jgi:hypothetical protein